MPLYFQIKSLKHTQFVPFYKWNFSSTQQRLDVRLITTSYCLLSFVSVVRLITTSYCLISWHNRVWKAPSRNAIKSTMLKTRLCISQISLLLAKLISRISPLLNTHPCFTACVLFFCRVPLGVVHNSAAWIYERSLTRFSTSSVSSRIAYEPCTRHVWNVAAFHLRTRCFCTFIEVS